MREEQELWRAIPSVPDLQCAWQLLLQCAGATVPPNQSRVYAEGHDREMQEVMARLLGGLPGEAAGCTKRGHITHAVGRIGSPFRVKNCTRCILGVVGRRIAHDTDSSTHPGQCGDGGFRRQRAQLRRRVAVHQSSGWSGFIGRPRNSLRASARPPPPTIAESGESGSMAGNTTRVPPLNTISGRPKICPVLCCRSAHLAFTCRSRCQCCFEWSSNWSGVHVDTISLPHNDPGKIMAPIPHCRRFSASAEVSSTVWEGTVQHVYGRVVCVLVQSRQRELSPAFAGKQALWFGATSNSER